MRKYKIYNFLIASIAFICLLVIVSGIITIDMAKRLEEDVYANRLATASNDVGDRYAAASREAKEVSSPLRESGEDAIAIGVIGIFLLAVTLYSLVQIKKSR